MEVLLDRVNHLPGHLTDHQLTDQPMIGDHQLNGGDH